MSPEQEATTSGGHANAIHSVNSRNTNEGSKGGNKFERSKDNWNAPMEEMIEVKFSQLNDAMSSSKRKRGFWLELKLFFGMVSSTHSNPTKIKVFQKATKLALGNFLHFYILTSGTNSTHFPLHFRMTEQFFHR
ncbi:unnamed protein product [Anisakis simplex]|uniref:Ovule protein n=1 Tax=Anisakis simplex TaxID=6269 RepID=A0A0M3J086_ANISI|nr:unnamed protein product [Anisakis simplex]